MRKFVLFVATAGGAGYFPVASGTVGSAVGLVLYAALAPLPAIFVPLGALAVTLLGLWAAERAEGLFEAKDDGRIVIDEVAGMLVALAFLPVRVEVAVAAFFLFRLFDVWKPPPARQMERLGGGRGVMLDDLIAGLYANAVGQVLFRVILPELGR